jgi:hypothetical protein
MKNIDPATWGGDAWRFLHTLADAYPDAPDGETRRAMYRVVESLLVLLPCAQCRRHLADFVRTTRLGSSESAPMLSGAAFRRWMDDAHLQANRHRDARATAAGGSVVLERPTPAGWVQTPAGRDPETPDEARRRALLACFLVSSVVLLAVFVAFVAVNCRRPSGFR